MVDDPVLRAVNTPHGPVSVRRIVGVTMADLNMLGPNPPARRAPMLGETNPDFLTVL